MSMTSTSDRFTALPDEATLAATVVALEEHGFSVEVIEGFEAAREAVLARIPKGSSVMTNASVTLAGTGIWDAINNGGPYYRRRAPSTRPCSRRSMPAASRRAACAAFGGSVPDQPVDREECDLWWRVPYLLDG